MHKKKIIFLLLFVSMFVAVPGFFSPRVSAAAGSVAPISETQTLMDVIQTNKQLTDFATLVEAAALDDNLAQDGPFTVFAPTNAAMASLEAVTAQSGATLAEILLYHIVNGRYTSTDVANRSLLPTLMGDQITIAVAGGEITLNNEVVVTTTDIEAKNGVVHIVDAILSPPVNSLITTNRGSRVDTLDEVLAADGRFTTFLSLLDTVGLKDNLANLTNTYTVFAPTDAAFAQLSEAYFNDLLADPEMLETVLSYHLVGDMLGINQIATDDYIPTVEGRPLIVRTDENLKVFINGQPLESFNIVAANGVIHVVDTVLTP